MELDLSRRGLLLGAAATLFVATAPAIVRPGLVMPIKARLVPARRAWIVVDAEWGCGRRGDTLDVGNAFGDPIRAYGRLRLMEVVDMPGAQSPSPGMLVLDRARVSKTLWRTSDYYFNADDPRCPYRAPEQVELEVDSAYAASLSLGQTVEMG